MSRFTLVFFAIAMLFAGFATGAFAMASRQAEVFGRIELIGKGLPFCIVSLFSLGAGFVSWVKE